MVLACEHASNHVPRSLGDLGLSPAVLESHVAWDPGARDLAVALSERFDAPLVASKVSRLVYDCNRPPDAPSAIPERSEIYDIPGNSGLSPAEIQARHAQVYLPFRDMLASVISRKMENHLRPALITIHSFTPVFYGERRSVEIGILHGTDSRLADGMLKDPARFGGFNVLRNAPYGPQDGVAHTIDVHGRDNGLLNVMIEVRNDLLTDRDIFPEIVEALAGMISGGLDFARQDAAPALNDIPLRDMEASCPK